MERQMADLPPEHETTAPPFRSEYLSSLQPRCKWNKQHHNLQKGDIVLLKDSRAPCNEWPMPVVVTSKPSADKEFVLLSVPFDMTELCKKAFTLSSTVLVLVTRNF